MNLTQFILTLISLSIVGYLISYILTYSLMESIWLEEIKKGDNDERS